MNFDHLRHRAELLDRLRRFFLERGFLEVETPLLLPEVIPELHIEPIRTVDGQFLQASPEFTIIEWYRPGDNMAAGIALLGELLHALLPDAPPCIRTNYREAFERVLNIDPHGATVPELMSVADQHVVARPQAMDHADRDEWLNLLLATCIEPKLGISGPEILYHYPASQVSLAATTRDEQGTEVAERFELYWQGIELANGFHELTDAKVLSERLTQVNSTRVGDGRDALPLPESLLAAMERGLPASCGVALGFDRFVMLAVGAKEIEEVMTGG
jgi:elongation factor P--(R)-beta-lysine ligase